MKNIFLSIITTLTITTSCLGADTLSAKVGYASWSPKLTGNIKGKDTLDRNIDMNNDLGYGDKKTNSYVWIDLEHPLMILPNLKIQKTNYNDNAQKATTVTYDGKTYTGTVTSSLTLDQLDLIGYYKVLDNLINLDLGLNFKVIDGNIKLSGTGASNTNKDFSAVIPMLYAKTIFNLPFTGFSMEVDGSYIGYSGSKFSDMKAGLLYETSYGLGATAGYRTQNITLDDIDDTNTNLDIKGVYVGLFYHF
jgi:outer membrane protein